jgi:hypothetical protein
LLIVIIIILSKIPTSWTGYLCITAGKPYYDPIVVGRNYSQQTSEHDPDEKAVELRLRLDALSC